MTENLNTSHQHTKTGVVETIKKINVGELDPGGNLIIAVHAKHNEYAIYEIESNDINNKLKVLIEGHSDDSEKKITRRFSSVKQKYIQATGMLSNTPNYGMLKRRIAHTLSTCLDDDNKGPQEFDALIEIIQKEHEKLVVNRIYYLAPAVVLTILAFCISLFKIDIFKLNQATITQFEIGVCFFVAVLTGASISILVNATKLNFEEYSSGGYYLTLGIERIFLAILAGITAFICIQAGILFPDFTKNSIWGMLVALTIAGFSESFIPSFLTKIKSEK